MFPRSEGPACWVPALPMAGGRWDAGRRHRAGLKQAVPGRRPRPSLAVSSEFLGMFVPCLNTDCRLNMTQASHLPCNSKKQTQS